MGLHTPPPVGRNIMNFRKQKNMSISELAKRCGVSKSMLSQIEQEKTNPTLITVWKIALALDLTIQELTEADSDNAIEVIRHNDATIIYSNDKSCEIRINSPIHMTDNLELYHMSFKPGGKNESAPHFPKAVEFLKVISGQLKVVAGNHSIILNKGDIARYRADMNHCIENPTDRNAEVYLVVWFPK